MGGVFVYLAFEKARCVVPRPGKVGSEPAACCPAPGVPGQMSNCEQSSAARQVNTHCYEGRCKARDSPQLSAISVFMHSRRKEISKDLDELKPATDQRREP